MKQRLIDLQLVKKLKSGTPAAKGKIALVDLVKEVLDRLQVNYVDACCDTGVPCPDISAQEDNIIQCLEGGIYAAPAADPEPENPFQNLQYRNALIYTNRYFSANGITVVKPSNWPVLTGDGISFTMELAEFAGGGVIVQPTAGSYSLTVPTAANIKSYMGLATAGSYFDFTIANSGTNSITLVMNTGVTTGSAITGGTNLVVTTGQVGVFRFVALDGANAYKVGRIM